MQSQSNYFSLRGLFALALSGFLTFEIFQVIKLLNLAADRYNDNLVARLFVDYLRNASSKGSVFVDEFYSKFRIYIYILLISFGIKIVLSIRHTFVSNDSNSNYVFYLLLIEAIFFGIFFGFNPFSEFFKNIIIIAIPTLIIYGLLED